MPTLSLANTVSYNALEQYKCDLVKDFPPIRVWGTIGFICAMWGVDPYRFQNSSTTLCRWCCRTIAQVYIHSPLPLSDLPKVKTKPAFSFRTRCSGVVQNARRWLSFSYSPMLLGAALQITNSYGDLFLVVLPRSTGIR